MPSPRTKRHPKAFAPTASAAAAAHAFRGLDDWIEVFYSGEHVDSKGKAVAFTNADLDEMVANVSLGKPPAVLGHPKHNDPAYGWADLKREGDSLFAKFSDLNPAFVAGVDSGAYRNRSVYVVKDKDHGWRVRHIGWLGAAPPALDGLQALAYQAQPDDQDAHEFAAADDDLQVAWALGDVATVLRGLRDWVISKDGVETADRVLPDWTLTSLQAASTRLRDMALAETTAEALPGAYRAPATQGVTVPNPTTTTTAADEIARAAEAARTETEQRMAAQFSAQTAELQQLRSERQAERIGAQISGWTAAGLPPAATEGMAEFMAATENGATEFAFTAAGATEPAKQSPAAWFSAWVGKLLPLVKLGGRLPEDKTASALDLNDPHAIAREASAFIASEAAAGRSVGMAQAVTHVTKQAAAGR